MESKTQEPSDAKPIFVVGHPRSGTTLLSLCLNAHSKIAMAPETYFLPRWGNVYARADLNDPEQFETFWQDWSTSDRFSHLGVDPEPIRKGLVNSEHIDLMDVFDACVTACVAESDKPRWGEKTPHHYLHLDQLLERYPRAKIVFIYRDPRAVVASTMKVPWNTSGLTGLSQSWNHMADTLDHWRNHEQTLCIAYEQMVSNPGETLESICRFLDEPFEESMLQPAGKPLEGEKVIPWLKEHYENTLRPIDSSSLEKWKAELTVWQVAAIEHRTRAYRPGLGYGATITGIKKVALLPHLFRMLGFRIKRLRK